MVTIGGGYIKINKYHSYDGYNRGWVHPNKQKP